MEWIIGIYIFFYMISVADDYTEHNPKHPLWAIMIVDILWPVFWATAFKRTIEGR